MQDLWLHNWILVNVHWRASLRCDWHHKEDYRLRILHLRTLPVFKGLHLGNLRLRKVNLLLVESLVRPHAVSHHVGGEEGAKNWFLIF